MKSHSEALESFLPVNSTRKGPWWVGRNSINYCSYLEIPSLQKNIFQYVLHACLLATRHQEVRGLLKDAFPEFEEHADVSPAENQIALRQRCRLEKALLHGNLALQRSGCLLYIWPQHKAEMGCVGHGAELQQRPVPNLCGGIEECVLLKVPRCPSCCIE